VECAYVSATGFKVVVVAADEVISVRLATRPTTNITNPMRMRKLFRLFILFLSHASKVRLRVTTKALQPKRYHLPGAVLGLSSAFLLRRRCVTNGLLKTLPQDTIVGAIW
jgi:hypothetical protein